MSQADLRKVLREQDGPQTTDGPSSDSDRPTITAIDLFCGAGGLSTGLVKAARKHNFDVQLVAVNHWDLAIDTHSENHPGAEHHNAKVEELHPTHVVPNQHIDILGAAPECTHFSTARGGQPVNPQKRASPWHVLRWLELLHVENFILENVPEFENWGPVDEDGQPIKEKKGETFDAFVDALHSLGYSVEWTTLNAANHGDPTSRERLFLIGRLNHRPEFPEPSHSPDGEKPGTEPRRPAAEIIDWSERGDSIWTRSRPLVNNTMRRIADGIRRHGDERFERYASALEAISKEDVETMQENVVSVEDVEDVADGRDDPFLVQGTAIVPDAHPRTVDTPGDSDLQPFLLGQHGGSVARDVDERPVPTVATAGAIALIEPESFVLPRNGYHRDIHSNPAYDPHSQPLHTVTAKNSDGHLVTPYLVDCESDLVTDGGASSVTTAVEEIHGLCVPGEDPHVLDVRYRLLEPRELSAAMGFPDWYEFQGNKTEVTEQIGNAIPVNLAQSLVESLLLGDDPTLRSYE